MIFWKIAPFKLSFKLKLHILGVVKNGKTIFSWATRMHNDPLWLWRGISLERILWWAASPRGKYLLLTRRFTSVWCIANCVKSMGRVNHEPYIWRWPLNASIYFWAHRGKFYGIQCQNAHLRWEAKTKRTFLSCLKSSMFMIIGSFFFAWFGL